VTLDGQATQIPSQGRPIKKIPPQHRISWHN
jgi:hypothetical protein